MKLRTVGALAGVLVVAGCGGGTSQTKTSANGTTKTPPLSPSTGTTTSAVPSTNALDAYWFEVTSRFPGGGRFSGSADKPTNPSSLGSAGVGAVNIFGPG